MRWAPPSVLHRDTPGLRIGLHVGSFEIDEAFHHIAKDPQARARFAQSLARIFEVFPMFTTLHLDWQWPSSQGAPSNTYGSEDGENYAALIRETKAGLAKVTPNLVVAVTAPASVARLKAINVPLLVTANTYGSTCSPSITSAAPRPPASPTRRTSDAPPATGPATSCAPTTPSPT
ncbi:hypothetical protein STANM309S_03549 [Streptomyces tanashiensis]